MSKIIKNFFNKHIDLSKVVSISDAYFINRMGSGGYYVGFEMEVQLLDKPIKYTREFKDNEKYWDGKQRGIIMADKHRISNRDLYILSEEEESQVLAVKNLQIQVDELIVQWKKVIDGN